VLLHFSRQIAGVVAIAAVARARSHACVRQAWLSRRPGRPSLVPRGHRQQPLRTPSACLQSPTAQGLALLGDDVQDEARSCTAFQDLVT
jgi:hypothetical protein